MNRSRQLIIILSILLCGVSCSEKTITEPSNLDNYITVISQVTPMLKAGYEGTSELPSNFYLDINQDGTDMDYRELMSRDGLTNQYTTSAVMKWKNSNPANTSIKALTLPVGYNILTFTDLMTVKAHQDQSTADNVKASDLLGAETGNGIEIVDGVINVHFKHLMSKIQVSYSGTAASKITSVSLKNVCVQGDYSYANMEFVNAHTTSGDITMYYDATNSSSEAIFYPYIPTSNPVLAVTLQGADKPLECEIKLKNPGAGFVSGKRYVMDVVVTDYSAVGSITMVKDWNSSTTQVAGKKVLWIGTSIPAGAGYPEKVAEALNCKVTNNAVGGSMVLQEINADWIAEPIAATEKAEWDALATSKFGFNYSFRHLKAGGLSQTREGAEMYREKLEKVYTASGSEESGKAEWVERQIETIKSLSYESLIIPYIDGTKGNCDVVVLDHGFNDLTYMVLEAGGHHDADNSDDDPWGDVWGYEYLMNVKAQYRGEEGYNTYRSEYTNNNNIVATLGNDPGKRSYIIAMSDIATKIREVNPDVEIIVGNYFTLNSPYVRDIQFAGWDEYFCSLICYNNEAFASIWDMQIVNVYKHLFINESDFWSFTTDATGKVSAVLDGNKFCPDGVHPNNAFAGQAIADIYISELNGVVGSKNL